MTTQDFPCDLDTTSIGLTVTDHVDAATKCSVMDEMLKYVNEDGTIQIEVSPGSYLKIEKSAISMDWTAALNKPVTDKK